MNEEITKLHIRKLKTELEKVVTECLLRGNCLNDIRELGSKDFDYVIFDKELFYNTKLPNDIKIFNNQILAIGEEIVRLEKALGE